MLVFDILKNLKMPNPQEKKRGNLSLVFLPKIARPLVQLAQLSIKDLFISTKERSVVEISYSKHSPPPAPNYISHILGSIISPPHADGYCSIWQSHKMAALRSLWIKDNSYKQLHETKKLLRCKHFRSCWKFCLPIWVTMPLFSWKTQSKALCF